MGNISSVTQVTSSISGKDERRGFSLLGQLKKRKNKKLDQYLYLDNLAWNHLSNLNSIFSNNVIFFLFTLDQYLYLGNHAWYMKLKSFNFMKLESLQTTFPFSFSCRSPTCLIQARFLNSAWFDLFELEFLFSCLNSTSSLDSSILAWVHFEYLSYWKLGFYSMFSAWLVVSFPQVFCVFQRLDYFIFCSGEIFGI